MCAWLWPLCVLLAMVVAVGTSSEVAISSPATQTLVVVGGQPDDITVDPGGRLVWGNLSRGTVERLEGRRVVTVARGLSSPEGVIALTGGVIVVAEQGLDRITRIGARGNRRVLFRLTPVPGQEGVDSIGRDGRNGDLLVPDSPRGTVWRMSANGTHARIIARGLGRPVDAKMDGHGNVLVPDEHLGTVVVIGKRGHVTIRGAFNTPDDVAVDHSGRIWVTSLGDGGLWLIDGAVGPTRVLSGLASPQGLTLDRCGDPVVVEQNTGTIIRLLLNSRSSRCGF